MDFAIHPNLEYTSDTLLVLQSTPQWGFNIGIVSSLRITEYTDLRFVPTLSFGERILDYTLRNSGANINVHKKVESTFIDFPFLLKYKSKRLNNVRAYLIGGTQFSIDLASQAKKKDRNKDQRSVEPGVFRTVPQRF